MSRFIPLTLACVLAFAGLAAAHDEPRRGKAIKAPLVTAYEACTSPNTVTAGPVPVPACAPPTRSDALCGFQGPFFRAGYGKAAGITTPLGDLLFNFTAKNLAPGCEGRKLCATASVRLTTERCQGGQSCTVDIPNWLSDTITGCCVVTGGTCRVRTSINREMLGTLQQGEKTGIEIRGCGLKRIDGPNPPSGYTFTCGVLAP